MLELAEAEVNLTIAQQVWKKLKIGQAQQPVEFIGLGLDE